MIKYAAIITAAAVVIALPFIFRQETVVSGWESGDPVLIVISPHNEAIRHEFAYGFSQWHQQHYGRPVKVDWRAVGGTTEIMRYLTAEFTASFRAWWKQNRQPWPAGGEALLLDSRFRPDHIPEEILANVEALQRWEIQRDMHIAFRRTDDASAFGSRIDLFFGGGTYDHGKAYRLGLIVEPWADDEAPEGIFSTDSGIPLIPEQNGGEIWRSDAFFGTCLSTFGICYNLDRVAQLGLPHPPRQWIDLTQSEYQGQVGVADPTKSGSIAKSFEMIIQQACRQAVLAAGYTPGQISEWEEAIRAADLPAGKLPAHIPEAYQAAVEAGWLQGLRLVQQIGANARYFTDAAGQVPIDVAAGDAAAGLSIDFYGRFQSEVSRGADGEAHMAYNTPIGGSSVSADPISLLRGAPHRELALRFIRFVLSEDGQKLWNYRPGTPGGPRQYALRRLPIRRDFYPSDVPEIQRAYERHRPHTTDPLGDPAVNPYALAERFIYFPRWTAYHFNVHRDLIRAMCLDSGEELRDAWQAILSNGGPDRQPAAMRLLGRMPNRPEALNWTSALTVTRRHERLTIMREWTLFFRNSYREAAVAVRPVETVEPAEPPNERALKSGRAPE